MQEQSYANHAKFVSLFHYVLSIIILISFIGALVNLWTAYSHHERRLVASVIAAFGLALMLLFYYTRDFAVGVQNRAIRAEENLRHFALTGKLLDRRLTVRQIVGLRFAS